MYGDVEVIRREVPKLQKIATDKTLSRFRVGDASVQMIHTSGDMTPFPSCQSMLKAIAAWLETLTTVRLVAIIMKTPEMKELQIKTWRRPYLSGR